MSQQLSSAEPGLRGQRPGRRRMGESKPGIRTAFALEGWLRWQGGISYLTNLLRALDGNPDSAVLPLLITGKRVDDAAFAGFAELPTIRTPLFDRHSPQWALRAAGRRVQRRDVLLERVLRHHDVAALSHTTQAWAAHDLAVLGWIADFQHHRLPDLFESREQRQRDRVFSQICNRSTLVIVSSDSVRGDLEAFAPGAAKRARVLRFVAEPLPLASLPSQLEIAERYGLEDEYFCVPNQFWVHKNHEVLIDALAVLAKRGVRPVVVATGATDDYRAPNRLDSLADRARRSGVTAQFRPVGLVPQRDLAALMRGALAIVNPSRCEGWSTSVEEAKSLGKRVLLSDIDSHREQRPAGGVFFDTDDPEGLADAMAAIVENRDPRADTQLEESAEEAFPARQAAFAHTYESIVVEALALSSAGEEGGS